MTETLGPNLDPNQSLFSLDPDKDYRLTFVVPIENASLDESSLAELHVFGLTLSLRAKVPGNTILYVWLKSGELRSYRIQVGPRPFVFIPTGQTVDTSGTSSLYKLNLTLSPTVFSSGLVKPVPFQSVLTGITPIGASRVSTLVSYQKQGEVDGIDRASLTYSLFPISLTVGDTQTSLLQYAQFISTSTPFRGGLLEVNKGSFAGAVSLGRKPGTFTNPYFDPNSDWLGDISVGFSKLDQFSARLFTGGFRDAGVDPRYFYGASTGFEVGEQFSFNTETLLDPKRAYGSARANYKYTFIPEVDWVSNFPRSQNLKETAKDISALDPSTQGDLIKGKVSQYGSPPPRDPTPIAQPLSTSEIIRRKETKSAEQYLASPTEISGGFSLEYVPANFQQPFAQTISDTNSRSIQANLNYVASNRRYGNQLSGGYQENQQEQAGERRFAGSGLFLFDAISILLLEEYKKHFQVLNLSYGRDVFRSALGNPIEIGRHHIGLGFTDSLSSGSSSSYLLSFIYAKTKESPDESLDSRLQFSINRPILRTSSVTFDASYSYGRVVQSPTTTVRHQGAASVVTSYRPNTEFSLSAGTGANLVVPLEHRSTLINFLLLGATWTPNLSHLFDARVSALYNTVPGEGVSESFQGFFTLNYTFSFGSAVPGSFFGIGEDSRSLAGTVFLDSNFNGVQDQNEKGLAEVDVSLDGIRVTKTDREGRFKFSKVSEGTHRISMNSKALLESYDFSTASSYSLQWGKGIIERFPKIDFGLGKTASVNALIFDDQNQNGTRDPFEAGVPQIRGKVINLKNKVVAEWESGLSGEIRLPPLAPGPYRLVLNTEELPPGYQNSWDEKKINIPSRGYLIMNLPLRSLRSLEVTLKSSGKRELSSYSRRPVRVECETKSLKGTTNREGGLFIRNLPPEKCNFKIVLSSGKAFEFVEVFTSKPEARQVIRNLP